MIRIKKAPIIVIVIMLIIIPIITYSETYDELVTINKAKELAAENHPKIKQQENNINLARVNERDAWISYEQAKAAWQLSKGADTFRTSFDAAKKAYDAATYAHEDSKIVLNSIKKEIEYEVESLYFSIINIENTIAILEAKCDLQVKLIEIERIKDNIGMSTQITVDKEVQKIKDLQIQLQGLYYNRNNLKFNLNRNMGRNPDAPLMLSPVAFTPIQYNSENNTYNRALETLLAIDQYNRTVEDKLKEIIEKQYTASDKVERLKLEIKQIDLSKSDTEYVLKITIKDIYEKLVIAEKDLVNCRYSLETAEREFQSQKLQYELGITSQIYYSSNELIYRQAKTDYERSIYDYYLATRKATLAEIGIIIN